MRRHRQLHFLTEDINTTTPSGKLTSHIFAALAEFEREILRQRVNAGLKAARRRGRVGGRPKPLDEADLKKARALRRLGSTAKCRSLRACGQSPYAVASPVAAEDEMIGQAL